MLGGAVVDEDAIDALLPPIEAEWIKQQNKVLQCVAVCCSGLQCVAVYCSALECAAVCCSVLQSVAECCRV